MEPKCWKSVQDIWKLIKMLQNIKGDNKNRMGIDDTKIHLTKKKGWVTDGMYTTHQNQEMCLYCYPFQGTSQVSKQQNSRWNCWNDSEKWFTDSDLSVIHEKISSQMSATRLAKQYFSKLLFWERPFILVSRGCTTYLKQVPFFPPALTQGYSTVRILLSGHSVVLRNASQMGKRADEIQWNSF